MGFRCLRHYRHFIVSLGSALCFVLALFHLLNGGHFHDAIVLTARHSDVSQQVQYYDSDGNMVHVPGLMPAAPHVGERGLKQNDVSSDVNTSKEAALRQYFPDDRPKALMVVHELREDGTVGEHRKTIIAEGLVELGFIPTGDINADWDVLLGWISLYMPKLPKPLKPHQKIPYIPGHHVITDKRFLYRNHFKFMPQSFQLPKEIDMFTKHVEENPDTQWLHKVMVHRGEGVKFKSVEDIKAETRFSAAQALITNPYLIDGRKMDIAIYVAVLSVNPLRVYINNNDWYIRFCPEQYHPFDINNREKYVIQSANYMVTWQMPSLMAYYENYTMSHKDALLAYLRHQGHSSKELDDLERSMLSMIRTVYMALEKKIVAAGEKEWNEYGNVRNFYELVRADFLLTDDMKVHLIEIGQGPSMSSLLRPRRKEQFRKVQYGLNELVGFGSYRRHNPWTNSMLDRNMAVVPRDLVTNGDTCLEKQCSDRCDLQECKLCMPCLTEEQKWTLSDAYMEHSNRNDWKRLIPTGMPNSNYAQNWDPSGEWWFNRLTENSQLMYKWFQGKCVQSDAWCK